MTGGGEYFTQAYLQAELMSIGSAVLFYSIYNRGGASKEAIGAATGRSFSHYTGMVVYKVV